MARICDCFTAAQSLTVMIFGQMVSLMVRGRLHHGCNASIAEPSFTLSNFDANDLQLRGGGLLFHCFKSVFHLDTVKHLTDSTLAFNASVANAQLVSRYCCKSDVVVFEGKVHL